jgi:hypothetical protein
MGVGPQTSEFISSKQHFDVLVDNGKANLVCLESLQISQLLESML